MSYMRTTATLTLSDVKEAYEKYHDDVDDMGEIIVSTELTEIAANAIKWGAYLLGEAVIAGIAGAVVIEQTAMGIVQAYINSTEAKEYAKMLKSLAVAGFGGYVKATLYITYEDKYIPYEGTTRKVYGVIVEDWDCYSDGSYEA